jgi:hypothetical protein
MKAIHYRHPKFSDRFHACGMGTPEPDRVTSDIEKVTCQRCLGTISGKKASNRQAGDRPKIPVKLRVNRDLWDQVVARSLSQETTQIQVIEEALAVYFRYLKS